LDQLNVLNEPGDACFIVQEACLLVDGHLLLEVDFQLLEGLLWQSRDAQSEGNNAKFVPGSNVDDSIFLAVFASSKQRQAV
jgi:hypothetical protein